MANANDQAQHLHQRRNGGLTPKRQALQLSTMASGQQHSLASLTENLCAAQSADMKGSKLYRLGFPTCTPLHEASSARLRDRQLGRTSSPQSQALLRWKASNSLHAQRATPGPLPSTRNAVQQFMDPPADSALTVRTDHEDGVPDQQDAADTQSQYAKLETPRARSTATPSRADTRR